jgi:hypothetical protein
MPCPYGVVSDAGVSFWEEEGYTPPCFLQECVGAYKSIGYVKLKRHSLQRVNKLFILRSLKKFELRFCFAISRDRGNAGFYKRYSTITITPCQWQSTRIASFAAASGAGGVAVDEPSGGAGGAGSGGLMAEARCATCRHSRDTDRRR